MCVSRGVGQSRVEINTHTHKMILIWIYERMSEDLSATHTHYNDVYYTWLPKYGQKKKPGATIYLYCIWWFLERLIVVLVFRCYMNFYNDLKEREDLFYWKKTRKWFLQREGIIVCSFGSFPFCSLNLNLNCEFDGLRLKSWFLLVILREIN